MFSASMSIFAAVKYGIRNGLSNVMPLRSGPSFTEVSSSIVPVSGPGCSAEYEDGAKVIGRVLGKITADMVPDTADRALYLEALESR